MFITLSLGRITWLRHHQLSDFTRGYRYPLGLTTTPRPSHAGVLGGADLGAALDSALRLSLPSPPNSDREKPSSFALASSSVRASAILLSLCVAMRLRISISRLLVYLKLRLLRSTACSVYGPQT